MSKRSPAFLSAAALATLVVLGPDAVARVSPLTSIEQQIQKPNMLFLFDVSGSMMLVPGEAPADFMEAGPDCDRGDAYCRTVGTQGRCYYSAAGSKGQGVDEDRTPCTSNAQCTSKSYCNENHPRGCQANADCGGDTCSGNLCVPSTIGNITCTSNDQCPSRMCRRYANDFCVLNSTSSAKVRMCRISQNMCRLDADCAQKPGDTCGPASSRLVLAKSVIRQVVNEFYDDVNFGFMTFRQKNYFPYYLVTGSISYSIRERFLARTQLEFANCFTVAAGPSATCTIEGTTYTRKASSNSRYRLNKGTHFESYDYSWASGCSNDCAIANVGTGMYEGTYYTYQFATAPTGSRRTFSNYVGRVRSADGNTYIYLDAPVTKRNIDNIHKNNFSDPIGSEGCAQWDPARTPFMDTSLSLSPTNAKTMAQQITSQLEKVSLGGLYPQGGTPTGCALKNDAAPNRENSVYHYLQYVKQQNSTNQVPCRPNTVLFVTDGAPGGAECLHADCAASPPGPGCTCSAVLNARALNQQLGAKVYVVGFSAEVDETTDAATKITNIARAGGTERGYFGTREEDLYTALTDAIYDSIKGSYSTSPVSIGAADADGQVTTLLDSRADFPSWKGHLVAYDVKAVPPKMKWDVAAGFDPKTDPDFWKKRNVWTSSGSLPVKIQVDANGAITNASALKGLGLGTTDAEAALVARWMLGDPALRNRAVPGAFVNSTPTEVKLPGGSLIYVGSSDGMLHAFHAKDQTIGGKPYLGGREAFAYIPEDMLPIIRRLYAQGGQRPAPRAHVYGLANSPKVKKICIANCTSAGHQTWQYVLVMPEGFGGSEVFALDITQPFDDVGVKTSTSPVSLLWHSELKVSSEDKTTYNAALGKTISLPGYYFGKTAALNDYRLIFASGYTEASNSAIGLKLVTVNATSGAIQGVPPSTVGKGASCALPKTDPTEPTLLADVAIARRHAADDKDRIAAAYVGDTWGNLFRWVPTTDTTGIIQGSAGTLSVVDSLSCNHPLHFAPTIVQLDRADPTKSPGAIFIAQVTNSALDPLTLPATGSYPASQIVIRKDQAQAGSNVVADTGWGGPLGKVVLSAANPAQICGIGNSQSCGTNMPTAARPIASSTGLLRGDLEGFALVTLWYQPDPNGCTKGQTFITVHEVSAAGTATQVHGDKIANEPVVGSVFVAGKLMVVLQKGPMEVVVPGMGPIKTLPTPPPGPVNSLVDRYRRMGWIELP